MRRDGRAKPYLRIRPTYPGWGLFWVSFSFSDYLPDHTIPAYTTYFYIGSDRASTIYLSNETYLSSLSIYLSKLSIVILWYAHLIISIYAIAEAILGLAVSAICAILNWPGYLSTYLTYLPNSYHIYLSVIYKYLSSLSIYSIVI